MTFDRLGLIHARAQNFAIGYPRAQNAASPKRHNVTTICSMGHTNFIDGPYQRTGDTIVR
jgi:hypothetical protein